MTSKIIRAGWRGLVYGVGAAAGGYAAYAAVTYLRYGSVRPAAGDDADSLLDRFMPSYEIVERHHARIAAPAGTVFAAACEVDFERSTVIQAIFKARELVLGSDPDRTERPRGLLSLTKSLGWGVLAELPGREVVMGGVTRPWDANPVFQALPPERFAAFNEPNYVKIVWNLRADPVGGHEAVLRTETRVVTTDPSAREKFRRYWSVFSPGIVLIRRIAMNLTRAEAERRAHSRVAGSHIRPWGRARSLEDSHVREDVLGHIQG